MRIGTAQLKELLNHLAGTAVYIIRRDTHELLYYNDRVRNVTPSVRLGIPCHDIWKDECGNCPLNDIGDADYNVTTNYDDSFGAVVDIAAYRLDWDGIPAFLISITQHMETFEERQLSFANRILTASAENNNSLVLTLDLKNDVCILYGGKFRYFKELNGIRSYSLLLDGLCGYFPDETREEFRRKFSTESVSAAFGAGERSVRADFYARDACKGEHWGHAHLLRGEWTDSKREALLFLMIRDEEKRLELQNQTFSSGLAALFGECMVVNLDRDEYRTIKGDYFTNRMSETGCFSQVNEQYGNTIVHEEDRAVFFEAFSLAALKACCDADKKEVLREIRRLGSDGVFHYVELTATQVRTELSNDRMMLLVYRNIDELKRTQKKHEEYMRRFAMVMQNAYVAIVEADLIRRIVIRWMQTDAEVFPVPLNGDSDDFDLQFDAQMVMQESTEAMNRLKNADYLRRCFDSGETELHEEIRSSETGRWYLVKVQPLEISSTAYRVIYFVIDVDAQHRAEEEERRTLCDALQLAEQANAAKSDFLSRMSHDIRTPMNAIIGMSRIAQNNLNDPAKLRDNLTKIDVSAQFLLSLINNILDMSKIESGKMTLNEEAFSLRRVCTDLKNIVAPQAAAKKQTLEVTVREDLPDMYVGDVLRLKQILLNLLSNAVKYTQESGAVSLAVGSMRVKNKTDVLSFTVTDNGRGMSEKFLGELFQPFKQESDGADTQGSGLGLAIARNLVHMMHGEISVRSEKNKGTTIGVCLPLPSAKVPSQNRAAELTEEAIASFQGKRVLIAEDNELNMEIVRLIMREKGFMTEAAVNGREAVDLFSASEAGYYDLILMDIRMPVMDGLEASRQIRALDRADAKTIPILALTANAFVEDAAAAKISGMNAHIAKPIEPNVLFSEIMQQLKERS